MKISFAQNSININNSAETARSVNVLGKAGVISGAAAFKGAENRAGADNNPVSNAGEKAVLVKSAFIAGLGFSAKLLWELADGDFLFESLDKSSKKIVSKQKNLTRGQYIAKRLCVSAGLTALFAAGTALLYTLFKAPEINYNGNINAFKNKKDMDVYIKGNKAETELYAQLNERAQAANESSDESEKERLRGLYFQLKAGKNQVPDFVSRR